MGSPGARTRRSTASRRPATASTTGSPRATAASRPPTRPGGWSSTARPRHTMSRRRSGRPSSAAAPSWRPTSLDEAGARETGPVNPPPDDVDLADDAGADADVPADARIPDPVAGNPWRDVVDQRAAVRLLEAAARAPVHAYLLTGPPGSGKRALARGFAAELHPDMRVFEPEGMTFRKCDAERMVRHATLAPVEGERKVVVALGCEEIEDEAAGYLLKIVEEPPASTVFVLLATEVLPELVTIASRCARVELGPLAATSIAARLVTDGVSPDRAEAAAAAAAGDLERARTLANDDRLVLRHPAWREAPRRLDGTGYRAAGVVAELQSMIAEALGPLHERQASEAAALEEQIERFGLRGARKREVEGRHKREVRRFRAAELRFGLATLAAAYRDALAAEGTEG